MWRVSLALLATLCQVSQCEKHVPGATARRTASPVDAFGTPVPSSLAIPNIPQALPPARLTSSAGYLELELVLAAIDLTAECEVFRDDADGAEPSISCFRGSCVSLVRLPGLKVDAQYSFTMQIVQRIRDPGSGVWFEFHGPRSRPITFVTAGLPDWQLAIPETTSLGSIVMRLSWEEPMTGGSSILGYQVEMETNTAPGWNLIYDGSQDPMVKHLVLQNLSYGTTYFYNVYAINAIGRSKPISTAYTVAVPLEKTFFYPLSTDPSIPNETIPDAIVADIGTELVIRAKNPVTEQLEEGSTHRNYLAAIYDACELNVMRSLCLPVPEHHPDYQDHRQRVKRPPDCCHVSHANGDGTYSLTYTGDKTGIYSLMVYTIFPNGLWGQYWDNNWFYGLPVLSRVDSEINFQWGQQEVTALAGDHITARWVGFLRGPSTNEYTIYVKADDSVKLWFQGELVVDYWDSVEPCCPEHWTRQRLVKDKFYSIRVDWKEVQGNAQLRLMWGITGKRKTIIPSEFLWRGAPLENTPYRIVVVPGEPSALTSGLVEPLERVRSSVKQTIYLQALDIRGNTVNHTNVSFEARFYLDNYTGGYLRPLSFRSVPLMLQRTTDSWLHDHLHVMDFVLIEPGNYTMELDLVGAGPLAVSPLKILAAQDDVQPQMCTVSGSGATSFTAGVETNFTLQLRDAFQNPVPHIDGTEVSVDLAFVEEINPNGTLNDRLFRNLTGGHYTTATSITKGPHGTYLITYTGLRAGLNTLAVKVNGLLIMGEEEQVKYNPPLQGQNLPLEVIGTYNQRADGQMTVFAPARLPLECTTGVLCSVVFHMRDTYGNRMLADFTSQLRYHTASVLCNPRDMEDVRCTPVDEGECRHLFGEMHTCDLVPTIGGNFLLRLLVNEQDASFGLWAETGNVYTLEAGLSYTQGPTEILMNIGDINTSTSTVEGPGLDLAGNVVGVPVMVLVQLKDQYGNNRIVTGSDFQQRLNGILASLGDTALDTVVNDNGTISVTVQTIIAGYHRLRIRMGIGCLQANPVELCDDISGSPSELLWWKAAEVSENGMTCDTPYIFQAGTKYHFTCTGRDLFSNLNPDHELQLVAYFDFQADPDGSVPLDGWFRGNLTGYNLNQSFRGSYSPVDSLYHFEPTVYRAGYYSIEIYLSRGDGTGTPVLVLPSNVVALGRPRGEQTIILCTPAQPSNMSSVVVPFVTASATVANEVNIQTRDRFGNAIEVNGGDIVTGLLYGEQQVSISFIHLVQGRYRGVLVPQDAGATVVDFKVAGESILGSPFDFLVTPGPMVITRSLVEGFPSELTAGKLSCWNITLRDNSENHLMSGQFAGNANDPTLESVTCSDAGSYCNHTDLNGTFTCCINKTMVQEGQANYVLDQFAFSCRVRGDDIAQPVNIKLKPHAVSPLWPDSSIKQQPYGMMGPYEFPMYIDEGTGWQDWPSLYFRRVQNDLSQQPQQRYNQVRLWYADGFQNVFRGSDDAVLLCEVKGPHSLQQRTLGRPSRPIYRLPYVLNQELGVFEVNLDFAQAGYHEVFCSTAVRGGANAQYFTQSDWQGDETRQVVQEVNLSVGVFESPRSARWDALLVPPRSANYTLILKAHGQEAQLVFENRLRAKIRAVGELDEDIETQIGPLNLTVLEPYSVQVSWTGRGDFTPSSVQLRWESDGGLPPEVIPATYLYHSKTLLIGYPRGINVSDVPGPVQSFERLQPFENGKVRVRWTPPLNQNGRAITSYRLKHDNGVGGDFTEEVQVEVGFLTFSTIIPATVTEVEIPVPDGYGNVGPLLDTTKLYRFEIRASNDDRADRDFQVDGGGISDQPVVIALQPVAQAGPPLMPVLVEAVENGNEGFIRIRISPPSLTNGGLMVEYRVYGSYVQDGVSPPLELWSSGFTPLEIVDVPLSNLVVGETYVFQAAYLFSQGESQRSDPLELVCCYMTPPQVPTNLRRMPDAGGEVPVQTDDRITVIWDPPSYVGSRVITHYQVGFTPVTVLQSGETLRSSQVLRNTRSTEDREMQFDGLSAGASYEFAVRAVSGAGNGPWSQGIVMPASGYSTMPQTIHVADQSGSSIVIAWGEPLRVGAGGLQGYLIYANVTTALPTPAPYLVGSTVAGQNSFTFTGWSFVANDGRLRNMEIIPGRSYSFFVEAQNAAGVGPSSRSETVTAVAANKPSEPLNFVVDLPTLSTGIVALTWTEPLSDGAAAISSYRVQRRKVWPGTFLSQCSLLINNLGDDGGVCVIGNFSAHGNGERELMEEQPEQVRIYTGRVSVRNVRRAQQSSIACSTDVFGDPLFPTAVYNPDLGFEPLRECYVFTESCADEPQGWYDADGVAFDCAWYASEPGRCEVFGVRSPGLWSRTAAEACCACGGGTKTLQFGLCSKEGGNCDLNASVPAFAGTQADYSDGITPVYFGKLESSVWDTSHQNGVVSCSRALGGEVTGVADLAYATNQFCYVLETDLGSWMELSAASYESTALAYNDVLAVPSHEYVYRTYAVNAAGSGSVSYSNEVKIVVGGLPDPPEIVILGSDQMTVRISWIEPPGQGLEVQGYRVYVDGELAYDGATDPVTREFTLLNCTRGELRDLAVQAVNGGLGKEPNQITRYCARRPYQPEPPIIVHVDCQAEATDTRGLIENHIRIAYQEPVDNGGVPLTGWRVQRAQGQSLHFRGVGPLFPLPEDQVVFDDYNDLDGAGRIGLVYGEIYKYRVVAVNGIDEWDDESASDYTIVRCDSQAQPTPWWLLLNQSSNVSTDTTVATSVTVTTTVVTGFVWMEVETTTTTTALRVVTASDAFYKLLGLDPHDIYLVEDPEEENVSEMILRWNDLQLLATPPTMSIAWTACNATAKYGVSRPSPCAEFFPDRSDIRGCVRLEFEAPKNTSWDCPVEEFEIWRNEEHIATVPSDQNGIVDGFTDLWNTASHLLYPGNLFGCYVTVPNTNLHDQQIYKMRSRNCLGWGPFSDDLLTAVINPPFPVCGQWGFDSQWQYVCTLPGLSATPLNATSARFDWILLQEVPFVDVASNFSRVQEVIGQVGGGEYLTLSQQLIGSYDPRMLLGYELFVDDGLGGPFQLAFDGKSSRWTNTATITLTPNRDYRAFVRAVSLAGNGDASNMLYFKMAMPLPPPEILSVTAVSLKSAMLRWQIGAATADELAITRYIVQIAMEPTFDAWFDVPNSPADNTEYSLLITQLEPDFKYATRILSASVNGQGLPSEPFYFWAGLLPTEGARLVQRVESAEGLITIQWQFPSGDMLGTGTRMEAVTTDWGVKGYMWDPKEQPSLVYDGYGNPTQLEFTVANATCGNDYLVALSLVTMIGEGPMSTPLAVTNARLPGVPRSVVVTNTTTSSISLAWEEPEDTGCVPIHQYRILRYYGDQGFQIVGYADAASAVLQIPAGRQYVDDGGCFIAPPLVDDGSCNCPPSCLSAGNLYRYQVQACVLGAYGDETLELTEGPLGCGPNSGTVSAYAADVPGPVRDIRLGEPEGTEVLLYWTAPADDGMNGSSYTYEVEMDVGGVFVSLGNTSATSFRVTQLQLQFAYVFRISSQNAAGYVTRSNIFSYTATTPPDAPDPPSPIPRAEWVSSAFFEHPSISSTPVPEGVTVRFSPTAVQGYAWAVVLSEANASNATAASIKAGTNAVGGALCSRQQEAVTRAQLYLWRLGSDDDPSDPTGCFLSHGERYAIVVYVQSVASFDAGLADGTLSGGVHFTVITGLSNTFHSSPHLNSPLTESGVTLAFTPQRNGWGWAMILPEQTARTANKETVYNLTGALGGPFCKHGPRQLFALREEAWVFSGCLLTVGNRYTVLAYISGIGAHLDGLVETASAVASQASNAFSTYPTISGAPSGDGITVQLRARSDGYLWLMITVGPVALTIDLIKAGNGAVGSSSCQLLQQYVDTSLQSFRLSGCKLNSGPEYALHAYIEGVDTVENDGSFAGTVTFQVTPSNIFVVYPSIVSEITGLGFSFQMTTSFSGQFWCMLNEGNALQTVEALKLGTGALGLADCQRSAETLTGSLQEILMTNCQLSQDRLYSLFVYIEDFNGNNDGILAGPLTFYVQDSNDFEDSPQVMAPPEPETFQLSLVAAREGFAWGATFTDYAEALQYYQDAPSFLDRFYPFSNESCAPAQIPVLAENFTNITFTGCGFNYSTSYWALIYIEGLQKTRSGAMSAPVEVPVPASNTFVVEPMALASRPYYAEFEMSTVKPGFLWIIVVHANHTAEVDEVAVKTGSLLSGNTVNCKLLDVEVNETVQSYRVENCLLIATYEYYAFFYAEGPFRAEEPDGVMSGPLLVWYNSSNTFIQEPRIRGTMTTNVFYFSFVPEKDGNFWAVVGDSATEGVLNIWNLKSMQYGQPAADCKRQRKYVTGGLVNDEEFLFCYFERGPQTYRLYVYLEDTNDADDGIMSSVGIIVPGSAEVTNEFSFRPYLLEPVTIRGCKFTFRPAKTGYAWAGLMAEASWSYRTPVNNSNGNHADVQSIEIYDIMFFVDMVGSEALCYQQAIPITAGQDETWEFLNCGLVPGTRYRLFVYVIGEDYWDVAADPDALTRSPFWNQYHRDNGRVSNGVLVAPQYSNEWAWPDGHPYISQGPHGMGMDVTFSTAKPQGLVWAVVQDAADTNFTISAIKSADKAWGPFPCRQMGAPAIYAATYTLTLSSCSLLPTPKLYVLILYTEDQAVQNDGKWSDPIYFEVPVSNGFVIPPTVVGDPGRDTGISLSFEAKVSGKVWIYVATKASADATTVTIPNVKDAVNVFDRTNCLVNGLSVPASLQVISMPNCPLVYLSSYVVYIYIEDHKAHFDGTLSTPLNVTVGASNGFTVEPALLSVPTTDQIDFRFTPKKRGRAWVVVTPSASLVEPPSRPRMVANVGAVGQITCRVSGATIEATQQSYSLTGCQLDPGQIYALYVYVEDHRYNTDGTLSRTVFVKVIRSNNFAVSPVLVTLPTLDGATVRFQATDAGRAWGMAVDAIGGSGVTSLSIRSLQGALGGPECYFQDEPIDASLQLWNFTNCQFEDSKTYMLFIYIEAWPSVEGDGMLSGPMIASFFDSSNVSVTESSDQSPVLIVENIPTVSNWFREDPRQTGPASPNGATLMLRGAGDGLLYMLLTRYRPQVSGETVRNGWNAVGGPNCQQQGVPITAQAVTVQLSDCGLLRGRYYYAFAYVTGPEGGLNGTLSPGVEIFVPTASNGFSLEPRLLATPRMAEVSFEFAATQEFGLAWVMMVEAWQAHELSVEQVKSFTNAVGFSNCRQSSLSIGTSTVQVVLSESAPNAGDGCGLVSDGMYVAVVYVEDLNGLNDGTLAQLLVHVSPEKALSNILGAGPMMAQNPSSSDVRLKFVAVVPGRYWAFILPSDRINVFTVETAKFMDLNPDTVGQATCRKNEVVMGVGETIVELTGCDLVLSGAGITFYSAFVYVEDDTGTTGELSPPINVLNISNSFLWPYPTIAAFDTNGSLSVELYPRNSGRLWARIFLATLYLTVERYSGELSLDVLKNWPAYPNNGPSYENANCSFDALDFTVELNPFGGQAKTWLNFSNCTFDPRTEYMIGIYIEDFNDNSDGEISSVRVLKLADASNYFIISPRLLGTAYADNFTMEFRTAYAGLAWCAIVLPEMVQEVPGASVMSGTVSLGGPSCCRSSMPITTMQNELQTWSLTHCGLSMDTEYVFLMYISLGGLDGTLNSGYRFKTFGTLGHIRVTWLQKETDVGGPVDRYRLFLNGTKIYDDYSLRGSLETNRAGSPPQWVRVVDVACTPGINYEITLSGRNFAGWSSQSAPLVTGCFLRPGSISNLREVQSWQLSEDRAALALAWDAPLDSAGADTAYYNVYRDQGLRQALFQLIGTTQTPFFNDTGLDAGRAYGYQVTAVNAFGEGAVSDVLFVQAADTPVDASQRDLSGLLSQANVQLTPAATFGVLDEVGGVVQIYSDMARELRVEGYTGQRQAHVAAFGPVRLALEALDLAGNTGEEDPCEESKLAIAVGDLHHEFCAGDLAEANSVVHALSHGDFALISWQTGWISSSSDTSSSGWRISLTPWR